MRILFVAPLHSPHTGRWISQLYGTGWDIHVAGWDEPVHPLLNRATIHRLPKQRWPFARGAHRFRQFPLLNKVVFPDMSRFLARLIRQIQPDCVHSLKLQEAYDVLLARKLLGGKLPGKWIYSSWGSDIYLGQRWADQTQIIRGVLEAVDYYIPDCERDIALAKKHGFRGEIPGVYPAAGAYNIEEMIRFRSRESVSERRHIALKGYQTDNHGRALTALEAIRLTADCLRDFDVIVHSAIGTWASYKFPAVKSLADQIAKSEGVTIRFLPYSPVEDIWALLGSSRISIAISASDGTPNIMLEAMVMGAFPIQSDTGATSEWIEDGANGFIVPHDDPEAIAKAIRKAAIDDQLVDNASDRNAQLTLQRLHPSIIVPRILSMYENVLGT